MRVKYKREGGNAVFPSLNPPVEISTEELTEEEASRVKAWVNEADFFNLPPVLSHMKPGAADYQQDLITVEDAGRSHSVRLTDSVENRPLKDLIDYMEKTR